MFYVIVIVMDCHKCSNIISTPCNVQLLVGVKIKGNITLMLHEACQIQDLLSSYHLTFRSYCTQISVVTVCCVFLSLVLQFIFYTHICTRQVSTVVQHQGSLLTRLLHLVCLKGDEILPFVCEHTINGDRLFKFR